MPDPAAVLQSGFAIWSYLPGVKVSHLDAALRGVAKQG